MNRKFLTRVSVAVASGMTILYMAGRESSILLSYQEQKFPVETNTTITPAANPKYGDVFSPGTLSMSRLETFHQCYVDPCRYQHHLKAKIKCDISEVYNLSYFMVGRAGSSTCRHIMQNFFNATEKRCFDSDMVESNGFLRFTFFREPVSRFLAGFQQTLKLSFRRKSVPERPYKSFREPFRNTTDMRQFTQLLETDEGNQVATGALQQFILEYDGTEPLDGHMALQISRFACQTTGRTRRMEAVFDTLSIDQEFQNLANLVGAPQPEILHAHERRRSIDATNLTLKERQRLCQFVALDYCCLNYELPEECKDAVQCQWTQRPEFPDELLIEAVSPYPPSDHC